MSGKKTPAYLVLYQQLRADIMSGRYPFGSRLPSRRTLASDMGVSVITAEHAVAMLESEGYVESRERSGIYVTFEEQNVFTPLLEAQKITDRSDAEPPEPEVIQPHHPDSHASYPPGSDIAEQIFPFSGFARTMRHVLSERGEDILKRSPGSGTPELRNAIAGYLLRSRGIRVEPAQIIIGSGSEYLYMLLVQLIGRDSRGRAKRIALEDPCYEKIKKIYTAAGIPCDSLKMGPDGIRSRELARTTAKILHVTPFNSYPSGITASASKRHEYINWAQACGGLIIEDDFASEFSPLAKAEDTLFSLEPSHTVIYMNTFTRTIAPSMRTGYMVLPPSLTDAFEKRLGFYSCTVPVFDQYVIAEFIDSGEFERHLNRVRRHLRSTRGSH
ncbi:MAG: PLP-dependent aminotransferase family protein [Lachnospiraceae bacterium]|jgi:GntR family transcriptional regulator/MocR family aminotransferase|nr:PLP-dependent aminotransferase family protein [Lachnospiraceae bacterium]MCH4108080.1 PLP-dependent aminotransferase family protein [Lachnospiraceae bacterium]MCI1331949.1 PLP-dependent aminotransferase family protein [Lachnospiraceae bacterium]MCI1360643.1 PLP-dependent aminotransferase family protein [Lachnospiraceae bacterium]MCI1380522.1 PLP-dependent aminotransferase family protein [Lachnospiraceae bacterium]